MFYSMANSKAAKTDKRRDNPHSDDPVPNLFSKFLNNNKSEDQKTPTTSDTQDTGFQQSVRRRSLEPITAVENQEEGQNETRVLQTLRSNASLSSCGSGGSFGENELLLKDSELRTKPASDAAVSIRGRIMNRLQNCFTDNSKNIWIKFGLFSAGCIVIMLLVRRWIWVSAEVAGPSFVVETDDGQGFGQPTDDIIYSLGERSVVLEKKASGLKRAAERDIVADITLAAKQTQLLQSAPQLRTRMMGFKRTSQAATKAKKWPVGDPKDANYYEHKLAYFSALMVPLRYKNF